MNSLNRRLAVAPMMDWTDKHFRYMIRLMTKHTLLYTEMITTGALINGDRERFLAYNTEEHPLAIQLGGSNPNDLARCSKFAEEAGYDEVNINLGCPSNRVQSGAFGACLMKQPERVRDCLSAMIAATNLPITAKCRVGVDDCDSYEYFRDFIGNIAQSGCDTFIIHARKAWLSGLSPKENRTKPSLQYDYVVKLKQEFPNLTIVVNGGISNPMSIHHEFHSLDGIMLGREAYQNPFLFADVDATVFKREQPALSRKKIILQYACYARRQALAGESLIPIIRHSLGLFHGQPGAKKWRRYLSQFTYRRPPNLNVFEEALNAVSHTLDSL